MRSEAPDRGCNNSNSRLACRSNTVSEGDAHGGASFHNGTQSWVKRICEKGSSRSGSSSPSDFRGKKSMIIRLTRWLRSVHNWSSTHRSGPGMEELFPWLLTLFQTCRHRGNHRAKKVHLRTEPRRIYESPQFQNHSAHCRSGVFFTIGLREGAGSR